MKIAKVDVIPLRAPPAPPRDWWVTTPFSHFTAAHDLRQATPAAQPDGPQALVVRVETDEGIVGLGNVGVGAVAVQPIIEHSLTPILVGADPFDVELLWEQMFRGTLNLIRRTSIHRSPSSSRSSIRPTATPSSGTSSPASQLRSPGTSRSPTNPDWD